MLRIETVTGDSRTVLRLIGRITSDEVQELKGRIADASEAMALDLEQVRLAVPPPYVRQWLCLERSRLGEME